jgi:hypothetical protein
MYRVKFEISIQQVAKKDYPNHTKKLVLNFVTDYSIDSSWKNLTDGGRVVIPKNLFYRDALNNKIELSSPNINAGGFNSEPLFMRGDRITVKSGYYGESFDTVFEGFITKVGSKIPIEFTVEDNMWLLKQKPMSAKTFTASDTLEDILKYLVAGTGLTVKATTRTNLGAFTIGNETAAKVLGRLQSDYGLEAYFRGNELRCGVFIYNAEESVKHIFDFNKNIIDDDLEYRRKDDVKLSAIAHNTITVDGSGMTADGQQKTKKKRLSVLVEITGDGTYRATDISSGHTPNNDEGERKTFNFPGGNTIAELAELAYEQLKKYYYTGFKGTFTTFGIPFVKFGDNVKFIDRKLPERNGLYKVKSIKYGGGTGGIRQEIELDFRIINE